MSDINFEEVFSNPENEAKFKEFAKAAGYESQEDVQGLKNKNTELLIKMKELKETHSNMQKMIDDPNYQEYLTNKDKNVSAKNYKLDEIPEYKRLQSEFDKVNEALKQTDNELNSRLKESTISELLDSLGFDAKHKPMLKQAFLGKATIESENGKRSVYFTDENGLPIPAKDFFETYAKSDSGKEYLHKPENRGSGSQGLNSGGGSKTMSREAFDKLSNRERFNFTSEGGTIVN